MFGDGALAFQEFAMGESLPLATIHEAVLEFLQGRDDAVLHGAQAVNAYVGEPRMTQDVDILALRAADVAEELRKFVNERFHIAVRVRTVKDGVGYRLYQVQDSGNRHLVDVRSISELPPSQRIAEVLVLSPIALVTAKVMSYHHRRQTPKGFTDLRDLALLLLTFPELKTETGQVQERLSTVSQDPELLNTWNDVVQSELRLDEPDDEF